MAAHTTTDSLERSLRGFSINDSSRCYSGGSGIMTNRPAQKFDTINEQNHGTVDLNSETPLPYMWEQCLDLKTGDIYFINRSNGVKTKEDPRGMEEYRGEYYYSDDEEEENESCDYGTEGCASNVVKGVVGGDEENVLVAAGCKSCLMYFMVPKQVNACPKCNRQLLHFDRLGKPCSSPPAV